jgi:drug/metabolite transporter (DMT)-like permease
MTKKLTLYWLFSLTLLALIFLSANSILAKAALFNNYIDAYSFTFFRIVSGAITLLTILNYKQRKINLTKDKNWISSFMLFLYAISFSYAYLDLDAGFGTLVLFGVVQLTMIVFALAQKEKVTFQKILGISIAFIGLIYLLLPHKEIEFSLISSFLMIIAGIAWAVYTVLGKSTSNALFNTTDNFLKATLFTIIFYIFFIDSTFITTNGILLAIISGSITSAIGSTECNAVARIVPFLLDLHKDFPKMQLELLTGTTAEVTKLILDYKVDIAFVSGFPETDELIVLNKYDEDMVIVEPKNEEAPDVLLLFKKGCKYDAFLQEYYKKEGKSDYKTLSFGNIETILGCVKAGMGRSLLPLKIVEKLGYQNELNIIELGKDIANIPTTMVCRRDYIPKISKNGTILATALHSVEPTLNDS